MGLDAYVRCRCWEEGRCAPTQLAGHIHVDEENRLWIDLPWETHEAEIMAFDAWVVTACRHQDMAYARERIGNWGACGALKAALQAAGAEAFATLLREVPDVNGGITTPAVALVCLAELDRFEALLGRRGLTREGISVAVDALRTVFRAAVEIGHPVSWC